MKQILIRHTDDISETDALKYAYCAWKDNPYRTGIVAFRDNVIVFFSDRSKYPSMTVCKDKQDNGSKTRNKYYGGTEMSRQHHELKIKPEYYRAIEKGDKTFEVRFNDRNYQKYDILHLREWNGGEYTGRYIDAEATYILDDPKFCKEGYVVMAIKVICIHN